MEDIINSVCKKWRVTIEELTSFSRQRKLSRVRSIIGFLVSKYADGTLSAMGES